MHNETSCGHLMKILFWDGQGDTVRGQPSAQRLRARTQHLAPLMADMHAWLEASLTRISGRSDMAKAIRYSLKRWNALTLVLRDGRACIDNSAAERAMRLIALGRRNWTFAGSDAGGLCAAAIYSLIETALCCARHGQVYAEVRTMPSGIWRDLIPVGSVGLQFGIVPRPCDRPLGNSVKELHRAGIMSAKDDAASRSSTTPPALSIARGNYAEPHSDRNLHLGRLASTSSY
jgi:Transposase IS66 family